MRLALAVLALAFLAATASARLAVPHGVEQAVAPEGSAPPSDPSGLLPVLGTDPLPAPGDDHGAPGIGQPIATGGPAAWPWVGLAGVAVAAGAGGGFLLVTRYISPKEALKNPQRAMLYGFIRGNAGVHLKKLSDEFAMKTSSILWHIRKLESAQLVRSERANGFRVFYAVDGGIELKRVSRGITALQNVNARRILEHTERRPGQGPHEIGQALSIHVGTVRWHLRKLRDFGLVEELVREDGTLHFPTPLGRRTLATLLGENASPAVTPASTVHPLLQPALQPVDE